MQYLVYMPYWCESTHTTNQRSTPAGTRQLRTYPIEAVFAAQEDTLTQARKSRGVGLAELMVSVKLSKGAGH
jgi:hypothetical protein